MLQEVICSAGIIKALIFFILGAYVFKDILAPTGIETAWEIFIFVHGVLL